jgi:hypothetical protein
MPRRSKTWVDVVDRGSPPVVIWHLHCLALRHGIKAELVYIYCNFIEAKCRCHCLAAGWRCPAIFVAIRKMRGKQFMGNVGTVKTKKKNSVNPSHSFPFVGFSRAIRWPVTSDNELEELPHHASAAPSTLQPSRCNYLPQTTTTNIKSRQI